MVNPLLEAMEEDVMAFLNEIQLNYPDAISLASGRPDENYFEIKDFPEHFNIYVDYRARTTKLERNRVLNNLGQYNRTKGFVNDLLSVYLQRDEKINVRPEDILLTVGTQEALALAIITLCDKERDVIIVEDPSYAGITGFSAITGYHIDPVPMGDDGISLTGVEDRIVSFAMSGKKVKLVYVIPDFQNPTGVYMSLEKRLQLLELAVKNDFYILEDNAYSDFNYHDIEYLPIKAFDKDRRVIYVRSFSKSLYPSLRLAALVADQTVDGNSGAVNLSDLMAKTKGYLTVNTPSINQAILGGILIKNNFSLRSANEEKVKSVHAKRDMMLSCLNELLHHEDKPWSENISWNVPLGGFFMTIRLPFTVDRAEVLICAEKYKVIITPMSFFYFKEGGESEIRIAFSNLSFVEIREAVERLARYFQSKF